MACIIIAIYNEAIYKPIDMGITFSRIRGQNSSSAFKK
jgi:hypothetical protein